MGNEERIGKRGEVERRHDSRRLEQSIVGGRKEK